MNPVKSSAFVLFASISLFFATKPNSVTKVNNVKPVTKFSDKSYLALGDSYTIGEAVSAENNFPNQLKNSLSQRGINIANPEIIAVTGWTTGDLITFLKFSPPLKMKYDLVTLLIGVNNQFRHMNLEEFKTDFNFLLHTAIQYAGRPYNVIVISIPDYSVTPFAQNYSAKEQKLISKQIKQLNKAQKKIAEDAGTKFINITAISQKGRKEPEMQTEDGLHPSAYQYAKWVQLIKPAALGILQ